MSAIDPRSVSVVVVAAGSGLRMGASVRKPWLDLAGAPVVVHVLRRFAALDLTREIVLVVHPDDVSRAGTLRVEFPSLKVVKGGRHRADSVRAGLDAASADVPLVAIQDAARPLVDADVIVRVCEAARKTGAAIPTMPLAGTIKEVAPGEGWISRTVPRGGLFEAQTPQVFKAELIRRAYRELTDLDVTDDAQAVERLGEKVAAVAGSKFNFKITTPEDLKLAEALLKR